MSRSFHDVLSFWFGSDWTSDNYTRKWFPKANSPYQKQADEYIAQTYGELLQQAENNELQEWLNDTKEKALAWIILMDQFSRHIHRDNRPQIEENDTKALEAAQLFIDRQWHIDLPVPQFVFALMPLRHNNPSLERLQDVLDAIAARKQGIDSETDLLLRFRRTTERRYETTKNAELEDQVEADIEIEDDKENIDDEILEFHEFLADESTIPSHPVYKSMVKFLNEQPYCPPGGDSVPCFVVSLSGGVDSMVVAKLLVNVTKTQKKYEGYQVVAIHIDYGNRSESAHECDFVRRWSEKHGLVFRKRRIDEVTRGVTKREEYERVARDIRYNTYAEILAELNAQGICFGHHRGDVQENVISNFMRGMSLLELNGMTSTSIVNGVNIWRPLLNHNKDEIFDFAHQYGIPYFKDTTPLWSTRGKLRTRLMPLLAEMYGDGYLNNLSSLGEESTECSLLVRQNCLEPFWSQMKSSSVAVWMPCKEYVDQGVFFWKESLRHVCHQLMGTSMIREKPMHELLFKLKRIANRRRPLGQWITLKRENRAYLTHDLHLILFRAAVFPKKDFDFKVNDRLPVNECIRFKNWTVEITILEGTPSPEQTASRHMWDIVKTGKLEYILPYSPEYVIRHDNRIKQLRPIEKAITDHMPLIGAQGAFEDDRSKHAYYASVAIEFC